MSAGSTLVMFGDGKLRRIPSDKMDKVLASFPDAKEWKPSTAFGRIMPKTAALSYLDLAPLAGSVSGSVVGGIAGAASATSVGAPYAVPYSASGGRMVGGVLGGMTGQGVRELGYRALGAGDAPGSVAGEAGMQAQLGPLGETAGVITNGVGRALVRIGLPARLSGAGNVVGEMIKERIPIGGFSGASKVPLVGKVLGRMVGRGSDKAEALTLKRMAARSGVNAQAGAQGVEIPAAPIETAMNAMKAGFAKRGDRSRQLKSFARRYADFKKVWAAGRLDPTDAQTYLTSLDEEAKPIFEQIAKGKRVPPAERRIANQAKRVANEVRAQMRLHVPGHMESSRLLGTAIQTRDAVAAAENSGLRSMGSRFATGAALTSGAEMLSGHDPRGRMGAGAIAGGALLASPEALSRLGLLAADPALKAIIRQVPRALMKDRPRQ